MFGNLGPLGIVGAVAVVVGLGIVTYQDPLTGLGFALVIAGLGLVVKALVSGMLRAWGMA